MLCAIIGRETNLAYAEIESVLGDFEKIGSDCVVFQNKNNTPPDISKFGSVIKLAKVIEHLENDTDINTIIPGLLLTIAREKGIASLDFGISIYGKNISHKTYKKLLISSKKYLANYNIKSRFVESKKYILNAAQIKHNKLITNGIELMIAFSKNNAFIGETYAVQDIDAYSIRDYGRPCRDMKVGMFPPKLAQSMIHIAKVQEDAIVYDPFCGSGIVLQEALLQNIEAWGSDISENMVKCSGLNLKWLQNNFSTIKQFKLFNADATKLTIVPDTRYHIVTEGYLGSPLHQIPNTDDIRCFRNQLSPIYLDFLRRIKQASRLPESIVLALPCWKKSGGLDCLNIIDQIRNLGYTINQFQSVPYDKVIYKRDNQIVGRQIISLKTNK